MIRRTIGRLLWWFLAPEVAARISTLRSDAAPGEAAQASLALARRLGGDRDAAEHEHAVAQLRELRELRAGLTALSGAVDRLRGDVAAAGAGAEDGASHLRAALTRATGGVPS